MKTDPKSPRVSPFVEYKTLVYDDPRALDNEVNRLLSRGWDLRGEQSIFTRTGTGQPITCYSQTMTFRAESPDVEIEYKILYCRTIDAMETDALSHLREGWQLYGPIFVGGHYIGQAIIRTIPAQE